MNATSPDELQYAAGGELRDSASRNYNAPFTAPVLRGSSSERPPAPLMRRSRRGRRFREPRYSLSLKALSRVLLTAAPLSLRRVSVARWDFISILLTQNE